ncbi:ATP-dependent helicase HrpB [Pseudemcibacter aquimaris]|uniref:ATP-dependent helicase HrpB n=1 Tax=Pseudemcibacter aquimaris TaxID=2857064 RepID=UPI002012AB6D|nr:ATP-dependent helicase HrpB [Pseudemcibacter aquimaris]MCC3861922.1 ATP-dependent helicase HrpB [Pseudemcibacter aquimaris]
MPFKQGVMSSNLPIYEIIPNLLDALTVNNSAVLQAPPGAGKTTAVPLELIKESWLGDKKIIMLEPRRLAARAAAHRMADMLGEKVGETVGYRVRMDNKVGPKTRIEVVTEGILIRQLQNDPELSSVGIVIFDEFHERSIEADLGLALTLDIQDALRDDLKILVMSATLDGERVAKLMNDAPVITSEGRSFDVEIKHLDYKKSDYIDREMALAISKALNEETGSILAFLPGAGEIERTRKILEDYQLGNDVLICPLYGMMNFKDQDLAISPAPLGKRKVVLSTAIAESSLTIDGIRIVIDSGRSRYATFNTRSGMSGLETKMVSRASADQRTGRAGRLEEGVCYRLWSKAEDRALIPFDEPEIKRVDLTPLSLSLAQWGVQDAKSLKWLDIPDQATMAQAKSLLKSLEALTENGITDLGRKMAEFPMHPRLAHMVIKAGDIGHGKLALMIAALLEERDILNLRPDQRTADLRLRLEILLGADAKGVGLKKGIVSRIKEQVKRWQKQFRISNQNVDVEMAGLCLAFAFPDRIAARRGNNDGAYILSGGRGARLLNDDPLVSESFIVIGDLDKGGKDARVFLAAPIEREWIEEHFADQIIKKCDVAWDQRQKKVTAREQVLLGKMPITSSNISNPDPDSIKEALIQGIRTNGLNVLPWDKKSNTLLRRIRLLSSCGEIECSYKDEWLLENLEEWIGPYIDGMASLTAVGKINLEEILKNTLDWEQGQKLDQLAPTHIKVPSGSNIMIDYDNDPPVLAVKLQEMFGATKSPRILNGKQPLTVHLLSPARRPLQITTDLVGFWNSSYQDVKKEMKGRYPKHPWPDDPMAANPTRKVKPKGK